MKIVVAEKISSSAVALLKQPRWTVVTADQLDGKLTSQLESADALIVRSAVQVDARLLEHANKLRVIGRAGVGVDNIDLDAATRKGIAVMNTPGANAVAVAEHTLALMLAMARHVCRANELTHSGKWEKKSLQGTELRAKTLGIVGLGRIGMEVAKRARSFGMEVIAHDPFVSTGVAKECGIHMTTLDEVYAAADYLTLHVGLTPQTMGMINAGSLKKMKKGARLVNCARGELVNEADLAGALKHGPVAGAAIDVFTEEPPRNSPLLALDNVILTPHIGGSTHEAQEAVGYQIALQVKEYLKHGVFQNAVNVPSVSHDEYAKMEPYIVLAERLGSFLAQASDGSVEEITIRYSGHIAEWKTELVRNAAIKGILNQALEEKANLVNAAAIADSRGLRVHEARKAKSSMGGAGSVVSIFLKTSSQEHLAKGAVLHGHAPRILAIDDIDVEAPLERNLIYMRNRDVPGVIGRVGTILGEHKINIANFSLGRQAGNGTSMPSGGKEGEPREAVAVVHVDGQVPDEVLTALRKVPAVKQAKAIRLF
ncbi:MAG: phosphoglycerate dehydrogenase [Acidobacteria bacterium]|nr:MAG: phosphoglycerate dehydrogenase [Acidobacteriota bacterium]PYY07721.1 MAG: phosphoglycerate dehydrogenase [Acidobacteriota bacterium]